MWLTDYCLKQSAQHRMDVLTTTHSQRSMATTIKANKTFEEKLKRRKEITAQSQPVCDIRRSDGSLVGSINGDSVYCTHYTHTHAHKRTKMWKSKYDDLVDRQGLTATPQNDVTILCDTRTYWPVARRGRRASAFRLTAWILHILFFRCH